MPWLNAYRWRWVLAAALLPILYLVPRLAQLDALVTTDEPFWLGRSANFFNALWHGRFEDTYQHAHPGVSTMWTGMVGYWFAAPDYVRVYDTEFPAVYTIHERIREMGLSEMDVLVAARASKVVAQAALFGVAMVFMHRLFGPLVTIVAGAMIALDPFLIAHDRLLHVDGLLTIAIFAAVLALADAVITGGRRVLPWIVAGMLAAIAWLTRSTAVVLVAVLGTTLIADAFLGRARNTLSQRLVPRVRSGAIWAASAFATTVVLWPALWVSPYQSLSRMFEWATSAAAEGHEHPIYFMGEFHTGDPGILFYPVTVLWRLSILNTVGLVLFLTFLIVGGVHRWLDPKARRALWILLLFGALYLIGMSLGAKKFDRYILPIYPVLDMIAALGIISAVQWAVTWRSGIQRSVMPAILGGTLLIQALVTNAAAPYYLDTYNPILGGTSAADDVVQVGWGEGVDQAAAFIIEDIDDPDGDTTEGTQVVRISGGHAPLLYALPPRIVVPSGGFQSEEDWRATSYYVATIQQWQRDISGDVIGYLEGFDPVHSVHLGGLEYVRVYDLSAIPPPDWLTGSVACQWRFDPNLRLENIVIEDGQVTLWFQTLTAAALPDAVQVSLRLEPRADSDAEVTDERWTGVLEPRRNRGWFTGLSLDVAPPPGFELDDYLMEISVTDSATGEPLPAVAPGQDTRQETAIVSPSCGDQQGR